MLLWYFLYQHNKVEYTSIIQILEKYQQMKLKMAFWLLQMKILSQLHESLDRAKNYV